MGVPVDPFTFCEAAKSFTDSGSLETVIDFVAPAGANNKEWMVSYRLLGDITVNNLGPGHNVTGICRVNNGNVIKFSLERINGNIVITSWKSYFSLRASVVFEDYNEACQTIIPMSLGSDDDK